MHAKTVESVGHVPLAGTHRPGTPSLRSNPHRIFLLSPANASGLRAKLILGDSAHSPLAQRLRSEGVPLGEIFSFISGLYFRGKLAYARAYADPPPGIPGVMVITASRGLVSPDQCFTLKELREVAAGNIDATESQYRRPLERDARLLCDQMGAHCEAVLLGSVATPKYVEPLVGILGGAADVPRRICRPRRHEPGWFAVAMRARTGSTDVCSSGRSRVSRRAASQAAKAHTSFPPGGRNARFVVLRWRP